MKGNDESIGFLFSTLRVLKQSQGPRVGSLNAKGLIRQLQPLQGRRVCPFEIWSCLSTQLLVQRCAKEHT